MKAVAFGAGVWLGVLILAGPVRADVRVISGPTPILGGQARAAGDITVINERLAFALAVETPPPYGVPRGAIIDLAPVASGRAGRDCVVFADFIPNNWSAWPNTYHRVQILERGPQRAVIRADRDWGSVRIVTLYTLESRSDTIRMVTMMTNNGDAEIPVLLSGHTLWPSRGYLFGVPGLHGAEEGGMEGALAARSVAYDADWSVALRADYADHFSDGSKDLYRLHSLASGESREFEASLQIGASGDLSAVIAADIAARHATAGTVHGAMASRGGKTVDQPVVVISRLGEPYAWVLGKHGTFSVTLPAGDYTAYATARGYSQSEQIPVHVTGGVDSRQDFKGLENPGAIIFDVSDARNGRPLDARVTLPKDQKPLVEFLGRGTFFTTLARPGRLQIPMAPGDHVFTVSAGGGFLGPATETKLRVLPGDTLHAHIRMQPLFAPRALGWYSADLHHHADQAEAVTPPADLARSQLAAGLDLLFVSDHDSTANHASLQRIADRRGIPFIPAIELSASWGHFNAYPITPGQRLAIDIGTATVGEIFGEARRLGADVIQVNHPFIPYGYFTSVDRHVAPGGFDPGFDLLEINAAAPDDDAKVLQSAWSYWNSGRRCYLAGGTDTHDVWNYESGAVRTFVHIDGVVSAQTFARALKQGHSYVTRGPLIFPTLMFGDTLQAESDAPTELGFDLESVAGLKRVALIERGITSATQSFANAPQVTHVVFSPHSRDDTWYSLEVEDQRGNKAYSNPIWVHPTSAPR